MKHFLGHLESYINGKVLIGKTFISLVKLEARLAGLSVFPTIVHICLLLIFLMTTWISVLVLAGYLLNAVFGNMLLALSLVLLVNLISVCVVLMGLSYNFKNLSFAKTREFLSRNKSNDESTKAINRRNNSNPT